MAKDPDPGGGSAGMGGVEEGSLVNGTGKTAARLNGDEDNQGRSLSRPPRVFTPLRVRLYLLPP